MRVERMKAERMKAERMEVDRMRGERMRAERMRGERMRVQSMRVQSMRVQRMRVQRKRVQRMRAEECAYLRKASLFVLSGSLVIFLFRMLSTIQPTCPRQFSSIQRKLCPRYAPNCTVYSLSTSCLTSPLASALPSLQVHGPGVNQK
ncbi:Hypp6471 [Branchiostoma lanceolatum]|nr:Hypp6471 [Branchiostoma lanceolatum]